MSAIDDLFVRLRKEGKKALLPFVTAGDPDLQFTVELLKRLDGLGCSMAEVGIPYSDPIADGPVIQASYTRVFRRRSNSSRFLIPLARSHQRLRCPW